jgi:hypothetical protein
MHRTLSAAAKAPTAVSLKPGSTKLFSVEVVDEEVSGGVDADEKV